MNPPHVGSAVVGIASPLELDDVLPVPSPVTPPVPVTPTFEVTLIPSPDPADPVELVVPPPSPKSDTGKQPSTATPPSSKPTRHDPRTAARDQHQDKYSRRFIRTPALSIDWRHHQ